MILRTINTITSMFCLAIFALGISHAQPFAPIEDGENLNFSLKDTTGKLHQKQSYRGKVLVVNFWASWCTPCIREMPELMQLQKQYGDKPFEILAINVGESAAHARQFAKSIRFDLPVLLDPNRDLFKQWGGKVLPGSFLIDKTGQVTHQAIGDPGWYDVATQELIEKLITQ